MIELVTRGDDTGASVSANAAVSECYRDGVLRNASVMAVGEALEDAARRFADCPGLCCGFHVTLNSEWTHPRVRPVLPAERVSSLVDPDGCFLPSPRHLHERGFELDEAMAEVVAQLARLREAGLEPRYLDEHMGVGWLGGLGDGLAALARREGFVLAERVPQLPALAGDGPADPAARLIARLEEAGPGRYVLVTHPLMDDEESKAITNADNPPGAVARSRDADRRLLLDPRLVAYCQERSVQLVCYCD